MAGRIVTKAGDNLAFRSDLLVQLMQFHRAAVNGGVEVEPTIQ